MNSGGAERVAANLVNAWVERGDVVTLVITYSGQSECFYKLHPDVELIYLAENAGISGRGLWAYLIRFRALRRLISEKKPGLILSFLTNVNIAAILCGLGLEVPIIVSERSYPPKRSIGRILTWARRMTYPLAQQVVMLSSEGLAWLSQCIPRAHGVIIQNPVSYPLISTKPMVASEKYVPPERKLLLAVGRLDEGKQFDILLAAFARLATRYSQWDLVILGEGTEHESLVKKITELGLQGRAFLPGHAGNLGDWYDRADLYVMSSRYEGFPNTLAEAMMYGCAAVAYDCDTGPRDIIRNGLDGLLVTPVSDVQALSDALALLMGDDSRRNQMARRAIEIRERYSMQHILAQWDAAFANCEKRRGLC